MKAIQKKKSISKKIINIILHCDFTLLLQLVLCKTLRVHWFFGHHGNRCSLLPVLVTATASTRSHQLGSYALNCETLAVYLCY